VAERIDYANLAVLTRKCGDRALTIIVSGTPRGVQEYVESTIWCIDDMNRSEPAAVRALYGGPLEYVTMEVSDQALDAASEGKVLGEITIRYTQVVSSNKVILISNARGNTLLSGLITSLSADPYNRYVHHVYTDYQELRHAILAKESSGADYKALDNFRNEWPRIRENGDSFAEVFRDPPVSIDRVREYSVDGNLDLLVSISTQVREAIHRQEDQKVVDLFPGLLELLSKKQKILDVWVGSSSGIIEELNSLQSARREVWEFWGQRHSPLIPKLLQSLDKTNKLIQDLQSAEKAARSAVASARAIVYSANRGVSPDRRQQTLDRAVEALDLVRSKATTLSNATESTYITLKESEAPDSERLIMETWDHIADPVQLGHVITSDLKDFVGHTSYTAKKLAHRALTYVQVETTALQLF
jgi:hypothetical protein